MTAARAASAHRRTGRPPIDPGANDALSRTFGALAHPARRAILSRLSRGEATVQELAAPLDMSAPAVSRHLKVLEEGGLIHRGREARWRPCRLESAPLTEAHDWIEACRAEWEQRFDRLAAYLETLSLTPTPPEER